MGLHSDDEPEWARTAGGDRVARHGAATGRQAAAETGIGAAGSLRSDTAPFS